MTLELGQLIVWIVIGAIAGTIATWMVRGRRRGPGNLATVFLGMIGAVVGGILFQLLDINVSTVALTFTLTDLLAAIIGSLLLIGLLYAVRR
jgi:uncharacterized membrane protein YeaQ/YmgE (transglycosylase-associated protein family)